MRCRALSAGFFCAPIPDTALFSTTPARVRRPWLDTLDEDHVPNTHIAKALSNGTEYVSASGTVSYPCGDSVAVPSVVGLVHRAVDERTRPKVAFCLTNGGAHIVALQASRRTTPTTRPSTWRRTRATPKAGGCRTRARRSEWSTWGTGCASRTACSRAWKSALPFSRRTKCRNLADVL